MKIQTSIVATLLLSVFSVSALAVNSSTAKPSPHNMFAFGYEGNRHKVDRTIELVITDAHELSTKPIVVKHGETIRFLIKNKGRRNHEIMLGTKEFIEVTDRDFKENPGIEHDAPYFSYVEPGDTGELVWKFSDAGNFYFGCIEKGHFKKSHLTKIVVSH